MSCWLVLVVHVLVLLVQAEGGQGLQCSAGGTTAGGGGGELCREIREEELPSCANKVELWPFFLQWS